MKEQIVKKLIYRLECHPSSLYKPEWSTNTLYIKTGWFTKVRIWNSDSEGYSEIEGIKIPEKIIKPLKDKIEEIRLVKLLLI